MRVPHSSQTEEAKPSVSENSNPPSPLAPTLAKILTQNPKLMIELAIEVTKLTQAEITKSQSKPSE